MKPLLSCLFFCFALFYSASSGAYNEAMCILIKQEMQQYSNDKTSRKYRNAARDYKKTAATQLHVLNQRQRQNHNLLLNNPNLKLLNSK
nr:hypothetical protein [Ningiella sp. W23]